MTLKKTIASYRLPDGSWTKQEDIDMHPLEEKCLRAHWEKHEHIAKLSALPNQKDEQELLITHGIDYVREKRKESDAIRAEIELKIKECEEKENKANEQWCAHVEHCVKNGMNKDSYEREKYNVEEI